jgi:hypothetical protein
MASIDCERAHSSSISNAAVKTTYSNNYSNSNAKCGESLCYLNSTASCHNFAGLHAALDHHECIMHTALALS